MKLSHIVTGMLSVALLAFMVTDTLGQEQGRRDRGGRGGQGGQRGGPPGGGFGGFGRGGDPTVGLLRIDEVKVELQISPDQEEALTKMFEQGRGERPQFNRDASDEERRELVAKMQKEQEERTKKQKEQLEEVLLPEQTERLDQIALQVRGVQALADDKVAAKLEITAEQKKKLAEVRDELSQKMRDQMRELFTSGNREGIRDAFSKARKEMEDGILAELTSDQKKEFEEMKGEPFKMPEGAGRGGFGGGGQRGNRGAGGGRPGGGRPGGGRPDGEGGRRQRPPADEN